MSSNPDVTITPEPLVIDAPTIAEALDNATGLIPAVVARAGITVECRTGLISIPSDWLGIQIRTTTDPLPTWRTFLAPFQINETPVPGIIDRFIPAPPPELEFQHGFYELKVVQYRNAGGVPGAARDESNPAAFRVDLIAPYAVASSREQPTVPTLVNAPAGTVIDNAFLINQGGLEISIPPNTFSSQPGRFEAGDMINVYFSPVMDPRPEYLVTGAGVPMLPPPAQSSYFLPASQIILSGLYYIFYTITDRAGNVSRPSFNEFRTVSLLTDPVPLEPFLPLAPAPRDGSTDDLLSIADYVQGIKLHIEQYLNFATGLDKFETQWESEPFGPQSPELSGFPVVFSNMNDAIKAAYTATLGPQTVSVRYRIDRNGVFFLSPTKTVRLDLSVEGPVLPGTLEPGEVNPGLNPAQVFGEVSDELNTLRIGDANRPVTIVIPLWNIAALPHPDNQFYLYWGASKERVGPFPLSTTVPGADATFTIPWEVVARHGNNMQPVSYSVIGPGTINENPSPVTTVNVIDAVTVELAPAEYERLEFGDWTCLSLAQRMPGSPPVLAAILHIPGDVRLVVGNTVTVTVTITNEYPELPPGPFVLDITTPPLTTDDVANGFNVDIIYRPFLAQVPFGPCEVTYTTNVAGGGIGRGRPADVYTIFSNPDSFCDGIPA
ncbi:hypothetical protein SAMN04490207_0748 [Pseudomonas gessardii]|uniref:Uncharacterized protein n=1 Tax=Pseudomonas gessardii TaxID=78544 RepID=A0A7Y1MR51_9PSED|nr:hypothetical protein [Pseudomonas gessardii]MRU49036.1 hypothetical protein [Pseudomonas gessardii]NNA96789.1 hypothetical protein [Pseudomonas gessardii]ONH49413.1 hypothetical protein BLL38_01735 [Pseudomonas gessardii]SDQ51070.1 hypothetical protein SAMN04490207_0748 [Pseudomonas gessardii]